MLKFRYEISKRGKISWYYIGLRKDTNNIFIKSTPSQKRTICEIIGSNFIANGQKIDISLYPVFYDIIEMNRLSHSENTRFELTETQSGHKKRASKKALDLNGGNDESDFA